MRRGCFTAAQVLHRQTDNPWMVCWAACVIFTDLIHSKSNDTTVKLLNCEVNQFIVLGFMCTRTFTTIQTRLFSTMQMVPEGLPDRLLTVLYPESDFVCGQTEVIPRNCLLEVQFGLKKQITVAVVRKGRRWISSFLLVFQNPRSGLKKPLWILLLIFSSTAVDQAAVSSLLAQKATGTTNCSPRKNNKAESSSETGKSNGF